MATSVIPKGTILKAAYADFTLSSGWNVIPIKDITWYEDVSYTIPITIDLTQKTLVSCVRAGGISNYARFVCSIVSGCIVFYADSSAAIPGVRMCLYYD